MEEKELEKIISGSIEETYKKLINMGLASGWDTCCVSLYNLCKDKTNAKDIKAILKSKYDEAMSRNQVDIKSEPML